MIALAGDIATVWICGIPIAAIAFGYMISKAPPVVRFYSWRRPYVFWCVAWPFALAAWSWGIFRQWWLR